MLGWRSGQCKIKMAVLSQFIYYWTECSNGNSFPYFYYHSHSHDIVTVTPIPSESHGIPIVPITMHISTTDVYGSTVQMTYWALSNRTTPIFDLDLHFGPKYTSVKFRVCISNGCNDFADSAEQKDSLKYQLSL